MDVEEEVGLKSVSQSGAAVALTFLTEEEGEVFLVWEEFERSELACLNFKKGMLLGPTFGIVLQMLRSLHDSLLQSHRKDTHFSDGDERIQPSTLMFPTAKLR